MISKRGLAAADQRNDKHKTIGILKVGRPFFTLRSLPTYIMYVERATLNLESYIATEAWLTRAIKNLFVKLIAFEEAEVDTVCQIIGMLALST